jgi:hypothetical protein
MTDKPVDLEAVRELLAEVDATGCGCGSIEGQPDYICEPCEAKMHWEENGHEIAGQMAAEIERLRAVAYDLIEIDARADAGGFEFGAGSHLWVEIEEAADKARLLTDEPRRCRAALKESDPQ